MRRGGGYADDGQPYRLDMAGPCSPNQWGRIRRECERLGVADDAARLALVGELAGRDDLTSTRDLDAGTAGALVRTLSGCATLADARRAVEAQRWAADEPRRARVRARQWAKLRAQLAGAGAR